MAQQNIGTETLASAFPKIQSNFDELYDGVANVKWFGAVGNWDGATGNDDTTAFQAALDAAEGGSVFVPKGDYLISSTLKIKQQTALMGEVAGIGAFENRGATIHASSGLTGYMIESVDYGTTDDTYMHGVRIENIQFRSPSISTGRNGIRYTYAGDVSEIKNCKFNGFDIAIGFEEDVSAPFGLDMVSGNINNTSIYNSNTGIYLEKSRAMLNVSNLMTDGVTTPISLYQTGSSLNFNINGWHAENITAGTNLVYVDDCNGRLTINGFDVNDNTNAINVVTIGATQTSNKFNVVINGLRAANASTKIINDLFDIRTLLLSEIGDISSAISYTHNAKNIVDDLTTKSVLKATYSSSMTTPFNVNSPFRLQNTNSTDGNYTILENKDAGGTLNGGILFENENQAANTGKIWFGSRGSGGWSGNTLLIDGDKVGVKNNSPVEALDVTGNIKASGNFLGNSASTTFTAPDGSGNLAATTNTIQELVDEVDGFSLGGGSGDVTLAGDNDFTGANSFEGWTIFRDETGGTGIFSGLAFTQDDGVTTKGAITYSDFGTYPGIQIGNNQSGEEIKLLDAGGLEFDGNIDLTTGHEFRINGIAISGGIQEHPDTGETGIRVGVGTEAEKALATLGASDIWISIDASPMEVETVSSSITLDGFRGADDQTADTASFTVDGAKTGGVYQVIINRATAPTITGSTIMPDTQAFVASTKMSLTFVVNADGSVSHKYAKL